MSAGSRQLFEQCPLSAAARERGDRAGQDDLLRSPMMRRPSSTPPRSPRGGSWKFWSAIMRGSSADCEKARRGYPGGEASPGRHPVRPVPVLVPVDGWRLDAIEAYRRGSKRRVGAAQREREKSVLSMGLLISGSQVRSPYARMRSDLPMRCGCVALHRHHGRRAPAGAGGWHRRLASLVWRRLPQSTNPAGVDRARDAIDSRHPRGP